MEIWNEYEEAMKNMEKNGQVSGGEYWNVPAELTTELDLDLNANKDNRR